MAYDLFISYSRRDNTTGRITEFKQQIEADYREFACENLRCFFDIEDIDGMDDWRHRILEGLRQSNILLIILSPNYLVSNYCEWEVVEYLKYEQSRAAQGQGVAPIYFVEIPGLNAPDFDQHASAWMKSVRRRNYFDLRPWYSEGVGALRRLDVRKRLEDLEHSLHTKLSRLRRITAAQGNLPAHNPRFVGREDEMRRLHEAVGLGKFGIVTALQGLGGLGKTSLAIQYAYAYADFYPGGRWLIGCAGESCLLSALRKLESDLGVTLTEDEKKDDLRSAKRILAELERRAIRGADTHSGDKHPPEPMVLLMLDNVDSPELLKPPQSDILTGKHWLRVLATTRLGADDIGLDPNQHALLCVDELPPTDALRLIESYQPGEHFSDETERTAAFEIAALLGGFTLAIEVVAIHLGERTGSITCSALLERLRREGLPGLEGMARATKTGIRHGERLISATLAPTLALLGQDELLTLSYAALLPPDSIPLPWLRTLVTEDFPKLGQDAPPGYEDPWLLLVNNLLSLRLLQIGDFEDDHRTPRLTRMHRMVQETILDATRSQSLSVSYRMSSYLINRALLCDTSILFGFPEWELESLVAASKHSLTHNRPFGQSLALKTSSALTQVGQYSSALQMASHTLRALSEDRSGPNVPVTSCHNLIAVNNLHLGNMGAAERHLLSIRSICKNSDANARLQWETATNLGCLYRATCRLDDAAPVLENALRRAQELFVEDSDEIALSQINLGLVYQDMCRLDDAISLFRRAVMSGRNRLGESHPTVCQDTATLAEALRNRHEDEEAELLIRNACSYAKGWDIRNRPIEATVLIILARIIEDRGEIVAAREILKDARRTAEECYGRDSSRMALYLSNIGVNSLSASEYPRAINEFQEANGYQSLEVPLNSHKMAHRYQALGAALLMNGDYDLAKAALKTGWEFNQASHDLLSGRILLLRILTAFLAREPADLFSGQVLSLLAVKPLYAPAINIRWSLMPILQRTKGKLSAEQTVLWESLNRALESSFIVGKGDGLDVFATVVPRDLAELWP